MSLCWEEFMLVSITRKFYMIKKHWKDDTSKTIVDIQYQRDRNLLIKKHWKDDTSKTIVDIQYQRDRNLLSNGVFLQLKSWRRTK